MGIFPITPHLARINLHRVSIKIRNERDKSQRKIIDLSALVLVGGCS
jgi:hypothetical protein